MGVLLGQLTETMATTEVNTSYNFLGYGSCRSADVSRYPNHYLKIGNVNREECEAQCTADQGCTHMEWGLNGHGQNQCVIFPRNSTRALHHVGGASFLAMA